MSATYLLNCDIPNPETIQPMVFAVLAALAGGGTLMYSLFGSLGFAYPLLIIGFPFGTELFKQTEWIYYYIFLASVFFILTSQITRMTKSHAMATYNHFNLMGMYAETMGNLSKVDFLTKLNNRYQFLIEFEVAWHACLNNDSSIALLYLDIDNLSELNSAYGHRAGDACLIAVADQLKSRYSSPNVIARYGSEEFMIALPHTTLAQANELAESLLETTRSQPVIFQEEQLTITLSIRVIATQVTIETKPEEFLNNADLALMQAKENGRDGYTAIHLKE